MPRVLISRHILTRLAPHDGLTKALKSFIEACSAGRQPPRIYKPSGIAADGSEYLPYLRLDLHHHHLHRRGDPLLITQNIDEDIYGIGLARHADYFHGDRMLWLQQHAHMIDWTGCEDLRELVLAHDPQKEF